jgi:hypothetical protein
MLNSQLWVVGCYCDTIFTVLPSSYCEQISPKVKLHSKYDTVLLLHAAAGVSDGQLECQLF